VFFSGLACLTDIPKVFVLTEIRKGFVLWTAVGRCQDRIAGEIGAEGSFLPLRQLAVVEACLFQPFFVSFSPSDSEEEDSDFAIFMVGGIVIGARFKL